MSHTYQGTASVLLASRHLGVEPDECLNENVTVHLSESGTPTIVRLELEQPIKWPGHANHVEVRLPDGTVVKGLIVEINRQTEGDEWLTFSLDD